MYYEIESRTPIHLPGYYHLSAYPTIQPFIHLSNYPTPVARIMVQYAKTCQDDQLLKNNLITQIMNNVSGGGK